MSSILTSQGVFLATAMAAVSGTFILLAMKIQKSPSSQLIQVNPLPNLRPCLSSGGKKKKNKRVTFAEDVVDPTGDSEQFRRQHATIVNNNINNSRKNESGNGNYRRMPANRVALYNGMLRDRVIHRTAYTY